MTRCGTDLRHQCGIFCGESQTSFTLNTTWTGSEEGQLFSQATEANVLVVFSNANVNVVNDIPLHEPSLQETVYISSSNPIL